MKSALEKIRAAGFRIRLNDEGRISVNPADRVTDGLWKFIRSHRAELIESLQAEREALKKPTLPHPRATLLTRDEWVTLAEAYIAHHPACPVCIAAGKGYGMRCGTGAALWALYDREAEPPRKMPTKTGGAG